MMTSSRSTLPERTDAPYSPTDTLRQLIRDNNFLLHVVSRFGIPFGFGDGTVEKVCRDHNVDIPTFLAVANLISGKTFDADEISLVSLVGYLRQAHRNIVEISLPHIRRHLVEATMTRTPDQISLMLIKFFDDYVAEVRAHIDQEEHQIFRQAELMADGKGDLERETLEEEPHRPMAEKLQELKDLFIYHYDLPGNPHLNAVLFDIILCERDLESHFRVEQELLEPTLRHSIEADPCAVNMRAVEPTGKYTTPLLRQTPSRVVANRTEGQTEQEESQSEQRKRNQNETSLLGEREKEIIALVAKGKSNKEMAEELFLSVHTVATHRRNIAAKLDIHSAAGLTIYAVVNGLVNIHDLQL